jgi:ribosomal protein S27AE
MPGGSYSYRCDRCPLVIEVGGGVAWDDTGKVVLEHLWVACGACGTMHRLLEQDGVCRVSVFPGPVRGMRAATVPDGFGGEVETSEFAVDGEVREVGELPGGLAALDRLACGHCGQTGRMVRCADLRAPGGGYREAPCPVCGNPLDGFGLSEWM